jgi:hypothetical protein
MRYIQGIRRVSDYLKRTFARKNIVSGDIEEKIEPPETLDI